MPVTATNLRWFYSGGSSNSDPLLSIGGVKSTVQLLSSPILHNLFDQVTGDEAASGVTRYRCLYFQNVDANPAGLMVPVVLYFYARPTNGDVLTMGLSAQGKGATATAIADENTAPAGVSFSAPVSKAAGLTLPSPPYTEGHYIGVWFKQVVSPGQTTSVDNLITWRVVGDTV